MGVTLLQLLSGIFPAVLCRVGPLLFLAAAFSVLGWVCFPVWAVLRLVAGLWGYLTAILQFIFNNSLPLVNVVLSGGT